MLTDRKGLLRATRAYRRTTTKTLYAMTVTIPILILMEEWAILYETNQVNEVLREAARSQTIERWQRECIEKTEVALWPKTFFPDIRVWEKCGYSELGYFITSRLFYKVSKYNTEESDVCM